MNVQQLRLFETRKIVVIGARCNEIHIVSACVHPGFEKQPRPIDLHTEQYLAKGASKRARKLEESIACIRKYPKGALRDLRYHWTVSWNNQLVSLMHESSLLSSVTQGQNEQRQYDKSIPRSVLYESFKGSDATRSVWGNIVVVKSDRDGLVCDVLEKDLFFIEWLVYR